MDIVNPLHPAETETVSFLDALGENEDALGKTGCEVLAIND